MAEGKIVIDTTIRTDKAAAEYNKLIEKVRKRSEKLEKVQISPNLKNLELDLQRSLDKYWALDAETKKLKAELESLSNTPWGSASNAARIDELTRAIARNEDKMRQIDINSEKIANRRDAAWDRQNLRVQSRTAELNAAQAALDAFNMRDHPEERSGRWEGLKGAVDRVARKLRELKILPQQALSGMQEIPGQISRQMSEIPSTMTSAAGSFSSGLGNIFSKFSSFIGNIGHRIMSAAKNIFFYQVIGAAMRSLQQYFRAAAASSQPLVSAFQQLKASFLTAARPIIEVLIPALTTLMQILSKVMQVVASVISLIFGKTVKASTQSAKAFSSRASGVSGVGSAAQQTSKQVEEATKSLASFDEINTLETAKPTSEPDMSMPSTGGGGGDAGGGIDFSGMEDYETPPWIEKLGKAFGLLQEILSPLFDALGTFYSEVLKPILDILMEIGGIIMDYLLAGLRFIADWVSEHYDQISEFVGIVLRIGLLVGIMVGLNAAFTTFKNVISGVSKNFGTLKNLLTSWPAIVAIVVAAFAALIVRGGNGEEAIDALNGVITGLLSFVRDVFAGDWEAAWTDIKNVFANIANLIIIAFESLVNFAIRGLNHFGEMISRIGFDVPDWVPVIGGKSFHLPGWHIEERHFDRIPVPELARGAVIPPNSPFLAMLGDQKSGTNIEAPLETIVDAFETAVSDINVNIRFTGTQSQLVRMLLPQIEKEQTRRGTSFITSKNRGVL